MCNVCTCSTSRLFSARVNLSYTSLFVLSAKGEDSAFSSRNAWRLPRCRQVKVRLATILTVAPSVLFFAMCVLVSFLISVAMTVITPSLVGKSSPLLSPKLDTLEAAIGIKSTNNNPLLLCPKHYAV